MEKMRELSNEEMAKISGGAEPEKKCVVHSWNKLGISALGQKWECQWCGEVYYSSATDNGETPAPVPGPVPNT